MPDRYVTLISDIIAATFIHPEYWLLVCAVRERNLNGMRQYKVIFFDFFIGVNDDTVMKKTRVGKYLVWLKRSFLG